AKMSKSKGNVINPDEMLEKYGADTVRLYLRFLGDFSQGGDWQDNGADGMARFVNKLWYTFFELSGVGKGVKKTQMVDKTIKVIGEDIEKLSFNTAVARYMEFVNWVRENAADFNQEQVQKIKETLAITIAPMAPHIAEEFWFSLKKKKSIFAEKWSTYNKDNIQEDQFELVIQINGKVRDRIEVSRDIAEEEAQKISQETEKIKKHLEGQTVRKIIYIREKLINIVV
ncbi:MAG: class I tRNA ligase family protein, partial [Candidatus Moranbacteria bacterium]|nr:class I tRNA ligase family protein [Candidatus Moranbacteria bacterium]